MSGIEHATNIMVETDVVEWTNSESLLGHYKVPEAKRFFNQICTQCSSLLPKMIAGIGLALITAGTLDTVTDISPQARIF